MAAVRFLLHLRIARRSAKDELTYRALYHHALNLERERLVLEASTSEEARRKLDAAYRRRAAAAETFHNDQLGMLHDQRLALDDS